MNKYPKYEPNKWNKNPYILFSHNCYAYALNIIDKKIINKCKKKIKNMKKKEGDICNKYKPQPGAYAKLKKKKMKKKINYEIRIFKDNPYIKKIKSNTKLGKNYYKIALFINNKKNYHFYRQDINKLWSHKDGWYKATNLDNKKKKIKDPLKCDRGKYKKLIGFYKVPVDNKLKYMKTY